MEVRQADVKRFVSKRKTYLYHRATGTRLPDLPLDHPDMIKAIRAAERAAETQSQANKTWGGAVKLPPEEEGVEPMRPPAEPHVVAFAVPQIIRFVFRAMPGDVVYYHHGNLLEDGMRDPAVRHKGRYVSLCVSIGLLHPRQKRGFAQDTHYFAARTDEPAMLPGQPRNVLTGIITPDEYEALRAIDERQASLSTTRAIRNALGISDAMAAEMRNDFIRRGWLTNTRPPELTPLGVSLMS